MSKSALSIRVFAYYLFGLGILLMLVPNQFLSLFQIPETREVWIRVVGMLVFILGYYYFMASGKEMYNFYRWTVHGRLAVLCFLLAFVAFGFAPEVLILFGLVDASAALWTVYSLRNDVPDK